jgi:UDP-glucose 4-epimerase
MKNLTEAAKNPNFQFAEADIRKSQAISPYFEGIDWVFHLAALADIVPSIEKPREYFETNVDGTFNVLEASKQAGVKRFLYAASSSCYGLASQFPTPESAPVDPQYPYALTKYLGEQLVLHWAQVYKLQALALRLFNVFGPRSRTTGVYGAVFGVFLAQKLNQKPFTVVGTGQQTRDFTYVADVADAFYAAAESDLSNTYLNVGSSGHYSVNRLVEQLGGPVTYIPKRPGEPDCTFADISKIRHLLGWKPQVSFEEGVRRILDRIEDFRDAPVWEPAAIEKATKSWFDYLNK